MIAAGLLEASYLAVAMLSRYFRQATPGAERPIVALVALLVAATGVYLVALRLALQLPQRGPLLAIVLGAAALFRLTLLPSPPIQEIDIYRYLWDGVVTSSGVSPFRYSPQQVVAAHQALLDHRATFLPDDLRQLAQRCQQSPALAQIVRTIHYAQLPTIYPPVSQAVFALTALALPDWASVEDRLLVMKGVLVLFDLATGILIIDLLRAAEMHIGWTVAYAWSPLVMKEIASSGHLDAIAVFFTTFAVALVCRGLFVPRAAGNADRSATRDHGSGRWVKPVQTSRRTTPPAGRGTLRGWCSDGWFFKPVQTSRRTAPPAGRGTLRGWCSNGCFIGAAAVLALAVGAKLYPVVLAPWMLLAIGRRRGAGTAVASGVVFGLLTLVLLFPMLPRSQTSRTVAADRAGRQGAAGTVDLPPPLPDAVDPFAANDPSLGLVTFLRRWEMNDWLFMIVLENVRPDRRNPPGERAWFSIVPPQWRAAVVRPVADVCGIDAKGAAFLVTRGVTASVFLVLAGWLAWVPSHGEPAVFLRAGFLSVAWFWLLSPTQNPWYWVWAMPLLAFARSRAWLAIGGLVLLYYLRFWFSYQWPDRPVAGGRYAGSFFYDYYVPWIEFGPWFVWLAFETAWRRHAGRPRDQR